MTQNASFAQAEAIRSVNGDPKQAYGLYLDAVAAAADPAQEAQIKLLAAIMALRAGNVEDAIRINKEVAANAAYPGALRASAVQELGVLINSRADEKTYNLVFSGSPYAEMIVPDDRSQSNRKLFEYASTFMPLAIPEIAIAEWYADQLVKFQGDASGLSDAQRVQYIQTIKARLTYAQTDINRMMMSPLGQANIPLALYRRAVVLGKLNIIGETSLGDAEEAFKRARDEYTARGWSTDFLSYSHALYLVQQFGESRLADVRALLVPISSTSSVSSDFRSYMSNLRFTNSTAKRQTVLLATNDDGFKKFLIALGWKSDDLKAPSR